jgi:hypothetical protein
MVGAVHRHRCCNVRGDASGAAVKTQAFAVALSRERRGQPAACHLSSVSHTLSGNPGLHSTTSPSFHTHTHARPQRNSRSRLTRSLSPRVLAQRATSELFNCESTGCGTCVAGCRVEWTRWCVAHSTAAPCSRLAQQLPCACTAPARRHHHSLYASTLNCDTWVLLDAHTCMHAGAATVQRAARERFSGQLV